MVEGGSCGGRVRALVRLVLLLPAVTLPNSGCFPEDIDGGLDIVNNTDQRIFIYDTPIDPGGSTWRLHISDCTDSDLTVRNKDGNAVADLTDEWCPGQTWTITGSSESSLTSE